MDGHISEELIRRIRGSQDIVEVISRHISLKKSGQNYVGLCPFHSEKTPSFVVSPAKQIFHCFGCSTGGNVITFLMKHENMSFPEAVKGLAKDAGIEVPDRTGKSEKGMQPLYEANRLAAVHYHESLLEAKEAEGARSYLLKRGISEEIIGKFNLGYSMNSWSDIYEYLKRKGFKEDILVRSGMIIPNNNGSGYYDRFRGRVMFPIYDIQGRVAGFGGRVLDDSTPKYLNSPETPIFSKGSLFYGLDIARNGMKEAGYAIIVEGYMDVIALHQAGVTNAAATLGTAFTLNHLRILGRFSKEAVLTFDSDAAGINAALRTMDIFMGSAIKARVLLLPEGEDPDSFIRRKGKEAFLELVQEAGSLVNFAIDRIIERGSGSDNSDSIDRKVKIAEECFAVIRKIPSRIEQDYYLKKVSKDLDIGKDVLVSEFKKGNGGRKRISAEKDRKVVTDRPKEEQVLLTLIIRDGELRKRAGENLRVDDFSDPQFREIAGYLLNSDRDVHDVINSEACDQSTKDLMTNMAVNDIYVDSHEKILSDCIRVMRRKRLEKELKDVEKEIASAELSGMFDRVRDLLLTKQLLLRKKKVLYENN